MTITPEQFEARYQKGTTPMKPLRKMLVGGALVAATVTGGAIGATFLGAANAATTSTPSSSTSSSSSSTATPSQPAMPAHGTAAHEDAEKPVTGTAATQAQAAAVKSVGSGTAGAVTTDFTGQGYEVTVTKADGTQVEVHLDSTFNVLQGGPHGAPGGNAQLLPAA
jgi:hypothetical protein